MGVCVSNDNFHEAYKWCIATFGHDNDQSWYIDHQLYYDPEFIFVNDEDAALFMLRWS